jgi:hypothetical protein
LFLLPFRVGVWVNIVLKFLSASELLSLSDDTFSVSIAPISLVDLREIVIENKFVLNLSTKTKVNCTSVGSSQLIILGIEKRLFKSSRLSFLLKDDMASRFFSLHRLTEVNTALVNLFTFPKINLVKW